MSRKTKQRAAAAAVDAMTLWDEFGHRPHPDLLAGLERAGTTYGYWKHICNRRKRPGADLARRLVDAFHGRLCFEMLLFPRSELRNGNMSLGAAARGAD